MAKNLKLKLARVELDMTQGDLAEAVGVTRQTIGLIESGKYNPSLSLCQSICRCLGKTLAIHQRKTSCKRHSLKQNK